MTIAIIVVSVLLVILAIYLYRKFKFIKPTDVYFISGAVKTGKTFVTVALAVKEYKKTLRRYYINSFLLKSLYYLSFKKIDKWSTLEKPMLYSNIKLRHVLHNPFTEDILLRKVRIPYKSVVILDEFSLIADSMLYKDKKINDSLLCFFKLWGHFSKGGKLFTNSQAVCDCHLSLKRCMAKYLYLTDRTKFPFVTLLHGIELINSEDNQSGVNTMITGDVEKSTLPILLSNKYYSYYDCYCYSIFTDNLTIQVDYDRPILTRKDSLKTDVLVSLQDFSTLDRRKIHEEA